MTERLPQKTRVMRVRLTEGEWKYIGDVAKMLEILHPGTKEPNYSEALRYMVHQTILFSYIDRKDLKRARERLLKEINPIIVNEMGGGG